MLDDRRVATGLLVVGALLVILSGSYLIGWELGTVADWLEAIGTTGALLIGAVALRQELTDRHDDRERRRIAEARLVTLTDANRTGDDEGRHIMTAECHNGTPVFITDVTLAFFAVDGRKALVAELDDLGPDETGVRDIDMPPDVTHTGVRWALEWTDERGVRWLRTNRGQVRRAG